MAKAVRIAGNRRRYTVRSANVAMLACIDEQYQYLAAEALAGVIRRQAQAGKLDDPMSEWDELVAKCAKDLRDDDGDGNSEAEVVGEVAGVEVVA